MKRVRVPQWRGRPAGVASGPEKCALTDTGIPESQGSPSPPRQKCYPLLWGVGYIFGFGSGIADESPQISCNRRDSGSYWNGNIHVVYIFINAIHIDLSALPWLDCRSLLQWTWWKWTSRGFLLLASVHRTLLGSLDDPVTRNLADGPPRKGLKHTVAQT